MPGFGSTLAFTGLALLCACGGGGTGGGNTVPYQPQPTTTVSGTVTLNGNPVSGATVSLFLTNENTLVQTATTGADGAYSLTGIQVWQDRSADYQLWAGKPGLGFHPAVGAGAQVTRFDYTGQFLGNGINDTGIYFTVIDYLASASAPLAGADFQAFDGSNAPVRLARTGQTAKAADGDDGDRQMGVAWPAQRFHDNLDGSVTDQLTGLTWLQDAGAFAPATWAAAVAEVNAMGGGWHLPNLNELESLVDVSASGPALPAGHPFSNVSNGIYWSSTSYFGGEGGSANAWSIRMGDGRYMNDTTSDVKATASNGVWPVKGAGGGAVQLQATGEYGNYLGFLAGDDATWRTGVPLTYPRWLDGGDGTVTDTVTGLVWLKQAYAIQGTWMEALAAVNGLADGQCGLHDGSAAGVWRMPNRAEMQSLADRMVSNHADFFNCSYTWRAGGMLCQAPVFSDFVSGQFYWTSTTDAAAPGEAWTVYSCDFGVYDMDKSSTSYTLAVR